MGWEVVIGLEIHAQLATASKIFSGSSTQYGASPNSQASLVDLGYPGVLPVLNRDAVRMAIKFGLATNCQIPPRSIFARKNYFYPDLPKGYQISQYELPIVHGGHIDIVLEDGSIKTIRITRAHLEEDAGKSLHEDFQGLSGIDLNRAGTPLLEIVSEPDLRSAAEAGTYMRTIHTLVRYLGISDGNMQEGSFRCDANVSIRRQGDEKLGTRSELKNLNSFRFVEKAIEVEVERQIDVLEDGGTVVQETRLYDADKNDTRAMRSKEEANDYRYFPDPDLLPVVIDAALIEELRGELPELPDAKRTRFVREYDLSEEVAREFTATLETADYFEAALRAQPAVPPKRIANLIQRELAAALNREGLTIDQSKVPPDQIALLAARIEDNTVSSSAANVVFDDLWQTNDSVEVIIESRGLRQISDTSAIEAWVDEVIAANPEQAGPIQERQRQGRWVPGWPGDEGLSRSSQSATGQPGSTRKAEGLMNEVQNFVFEDVGIRGSLVRLEETWRDVIAEHDYPDNVRRLLGEGVAATVLMTTGLKGSPKVSLQLQGDGPLRLLLIQCSGELQVRGMAQWREASKDKALLGEGRLAVNLDAGGPGRIFQGIVPLVSNEIDGCLEAYFRQSEQLPTRLVLRTTEERVAGLILQALPQNDPSDETFETAVAMAGTVSAEELSELPAKRLLPRLFEGFAIRLFKARPVSHDCRCSPTHLAGVVRMLGAEELDDLLAERGEVELTCEFCNRVFQYDETDIQTILSGHTPGQVLH